MTFNIGLTSAKHGEGLSQKYTCDGQDYSPEIAWSDPPSSTKSFILIMEDPDAPRGTFVHWVLYNIKPDVKQLHENVTKEKVTDEGWAQGLNSFKKIGYNGPCPPRKKVHRYIFYLYAVLHKPDLEPGLSKNDLLNIINDETVKQASIMVKYGRSYE
ncbi:MAG: YbhB/YbcL family Raf kinase inhibitor-like protein [Candidatus Thermoplasmatota archaeon]|jgi:Raf kinase inhibitor-like YbhB/YbcL family protein|nr:YbhB/YbcL family Raf kinase inhibitor-like protein [Candidatus Thermoplasmatota archaeon]MCL5955774.1 YbhB/YbcL family Raf kinase inhibitor-like protein [Candidatus Thermoplasmatota archaeon]